jgi:hypothetical protein
MPLDGIVPKTRFAAQKMESEDGQVVQHPKAHLAQFRFDRAKREAEEREYRKAHRRRLRETKSRRDRYRAIRTSRNRLEAHIDDVVWRAANVVSKEGHHLSGSSHDDAFMNSVLDLRSKIAAAAESICAEAAGFDSWDAFEKAQELAEYQHSVAAENPLQGA